jgi:energy-coupling factor transporter ATP-binding protein EcfA2
MPSPHDPVIEAKNITASYAGSIRLKDVSVAFPRNQVTAIMGPSGCGKSTLLRALNRTLELTPGAKVNKGSVLFENKDNEAFLHVTGVKAAGRAPVGLSLWRPEATVDWLAADPSEPALAFLPSRLWLIGLGHLGQAYLWGLGLLPYRAPGEVKLVLQDVDAITPSTESTSILTDGTLIGIQKTRAMAAWTERRGFQAAILERLFDADFRRRPEEPAIALCGLDNAAGRRALDQVGFDMIVEAGLGRGHRDFRTLRLHTLPGARPSAEMWKATPGAERVDDQPAYAKLMAEGVLDRCGMTLLAGKAVGAPFVGAVAATLVLSEVLRLLHGGAVHRLIDLDLLGVEHRTVAPHGDAFARLNPGFTAVGES